MNHARTFFKRECCTRGMASHYRHGVAGLHKLDVSDILVSNAEL